MVISSNFLSSLRSNPIGNDIFTPWMKPVEIKALCGTDDRISTTMRMSPLQADVIQKKCLNN
jgi:hypothetical protein